MSEETTHTGLLQGVKDAVSNISETIKEKAEAAIETIKDFVSPSKEEGGEAEAQKGEESTQDLKRYEDETISKMSDQTAENKGENKEDVENALMDKGKGFYEDTQQKLEGKKEELKEKGEQLKEEVTEKKDEMMGKGKEKVDEAKGKLKETMSQAAEFGKETYEKAKENLSQVKNKVGDYVEAATDKAKELASSAKEKAANLGEKISEGAEKCLGDTPEGQETTEKKPGLIDSAKQKLDDMGQAISGRAENLLGPMEAPADLQEVFNEKKPKDTSPSQQNEENMEQKQPSGMENLLEGPADVEQDLAEKKPEEPVHFENPIYDPNSEYAQDTLQRQAELGREVKNATKNFDELIKECTEGTQP